MYSLDTHQRLASTCVVFGGAHGEVSELARQSGLSRQCLYRQAHSVAAATEGTLHAQQLQRLHDSIASQQLEIGTLRQQLSGAVFIDDDCLAHFASRSQAEGVSLPVARRLLQILLGDRAASVATLGRFSKDASSKASATLAVLDEFSRPLVRDAALDELFVGSKPILMTVELNSLSWVGGKLSDSRDGEAWACQLRQLPALQFVSRDAGNGLDGGIKASNAERRQAQRPLLADQDDHFHLLREGNRALRRLQARAAGAMEKAAQADKKRQKLARQLRNEAGAAGVAKKAWNKAEKLYQHWSAADDAWQRVKQQALPLFTPDGQLNSRAKAEKVLACVLPALEDEVWAKLRRLLRRGGYFTFLDRANRELAELPLSQELVQAALELEGARRRPEAAAGDSDKKGLYRAIVTVATVMLSLAGEAGKQAVTLVRGVLSGAHRASSAVEGLNSVVRMHQGRHRRLTQGLLDLKRLNWNCRKLRTGKRKKHSPYQLLGLRLPTDDWWQLLKIPPDQLRQHLSAQQLAS